MQKNIQISQEAEDKTQMIRTTPALDRTTKKGRKKDQAKEIQQLVQTFHREVRCHKDKECMKEQRIRVSTTT